MSRGIVFFAAITWLVHAGVYLLFTVNCGVREIVAAACVASVTTVAVLVVARTGEVQISIRLRDAAQAWRVPAAAITGTVVVLKTAIQQLVMRTPAASVLDSVWFDTGKDNDPAAAGRAALATMLTTATPNMIVLDVSAAGVPKDQRLMLYHQIVRDRISRMTQELGAHP